MSLPFVTSVDAKPIHIADGVKRFYAQTAIYSYELQTKDCRNSDQCDRDSDCDSKFINRCAYSLVTSQMSLISQGGSTSKTENCLTAMKQTETKVR